MCKAVRNRYAELLGVAADEIVVHRVLMSSFEVAESLLAVIRDGAVTASEDWSNVGVVHGEQFEKFLFPDAQVAWVRARYGTRDECKSKVGEVE